MALGYPHIRESRHAIGVGGQKGDLVWGQRVACDWQFFFFCRCWWYSDVAGWEGDVMVVGRQHHLLCCELGGKGKTKQRVSDVGPGTGIMTKHSTSPTGRVSRWRRKYTVLHVLGSTDSLSMANSYWLGYSSSNTPETYPSVISVWTGVLGPSEQRGPVLCWKRSL